jgi:hypothetical protein
MRGGMGQLSGLGGYSGNGLKPRKSSMSRLFFLHDSSILLSENVRQKL